MFTNATRMIGTVLQRKLRQIFIGVFICGLLFGGCIARLGFHIPICLSDTRVPGAAFLVALGLPFLASYVVFQFLKPALVLPICFLKAFSYSYFGCGILLQYGSAGWLIRLLLTFSDGLALLVLCWYWLRHIEGNRFLLHRDTAVCAGIVLVIGVVDIMYISPFLALVLQG